MKNTPMAKSQQSQLQFLPNSLSEGTSSLQPDILLACQIRPRNNMLHRSEWLLMWALLMDALHVLSAYHPHRHRRNSKEKRQWETDCTWVRDTSEAPFSFVYVCDHLGLDREAVRMHVERLIAGEEIRLETLSL
jgi:hypothetical protein